MYTKTINGSNIFLFDKVLAIRCIFGVKSFAVYHVYQEFDI